MMTLEKLIADRLASPDHYEYIEANTAKVTTEADERFYMLWEKNTITKAEKCEMANLHSECIAETEMEQYFRGFFDALALIPGHGLTEKGLLAAIEKSKEELDERLCREIEERYGMSSKVKVAQRA